MAEAVGTDHSVKYSLISEKTDINFVPVVVDASVSDDSQPGVYLVKVTLNKSGRYLLNIFFRGLEVPTMLTEILVTPAQATNALTSNFTGVMEPYKTGEKIIITI